MFTYNDIGIGIPIVFIHGLGSRKEAWLPQYPLAKRYRLIIPDLRGHGENPANKDLTLKSFAFDVIKLLESLSISSAFVCGLSLGGIVAQEIYRQRPEMVRGLVLANTTSYIPSLLASPMIYLSHYLLQKEQQEELIKHITITSIHDQSYKEEARKAFYIRDTYIECAKAAVGRNYFSVLPSIRKPVLLIGSTHDKVIPAVNQYLMRNCLWNARIAILEDTGHLSNIERKDRFNQYVMEFIERSA